jgi:hypothetical protein
MRTLFSTLVVALLVVGCSAQTTSTNVLGDSQEECMTMCLQAQDSCFWALSPQPCDVFCGSLHVSATDANVVCADSHAWDHYADCQSCILNQTQCDFAHQGGTVCADECAPSPTDDSACM